MDRNTRQVLAALVEVTNLLSDRLEQCHPASAESECWAGVGRSVLNALDMALTLREAERMVGL